MKGNQNRLCSSKEFYNQNEVRLIQADALELSKYIGREKFDLIYMDPPFFTNTVLRGRSRIPHLFEGILSFKDIFASLEDFGRFLEERFYIFKKHLTSDGLILVHLDYRGVSLAFQLLGKIFGFQNQVGEVIWTYGLGGGKVETSYSRKHDNILIWARDRTKVKLESQVIKEWGSVWEISSLNPMSKERVGYPTQKPLELIDRLMDLFPYTKSVLDPFCGSGTTLIAAKRKGIKALGLDLSLDALTFSKERLQMVKDWNLDHRHFDPMILSNLKEGG